jgi:hypothetical protein
MEHNAELRILLRCSPTPKFFYELFEDGDLELR